jgi:hypothetical protein
MSTQSLIHYLNTAVGKALNSYNEHKHEDKLLRDLCLIILNLANTEYIDRDDVDNFNQLNNIVRILRDKSLPIMVRINLSFGAFISWYEFLADDIPRGQKRDLDGYEIPNNKRQKK